MAWINTEEGQRAVEDCMFQVQTDSNTLQRLVAKASHDANGWRDRMEQPFSASVYTDEEFAQYAMQYVIAYRKRRRINNALRVLATESVLAGIHVVDERL